jgi:hypothetical protein
VARSSGRALACDDSVERQDFDWNIVDLDALGALELALECVETVSVGDYIESICFRQAADLRALHAKRSRNPYATGGLGCLCDARIAEIREPQIHVDCRDPRSLRVGALAPINK